MLQTRLYRYMSISINDDVLMSVGLEIPCAYQSEGTRPRTRARLGSDAPHLGSYSCSLLEHPAVCSCLHVNLSV